MHQPQRNEPTRQGLIQAQAITKRYASTFYFASRFPAKDKRLAAYSVYAMCRISDESVDSAAAVVGLMLLKSLIEAQYL